MKLKRGKEFRNKVVSGEEKYLLIAPKPLLPITRESNLRSSTASISFSLGSPQ
jgi:hypothetical protein